jgi:hypothetical protein
MRPQIVRPNNGFGARVTGHLPRHAVLPYYSAARWGAAGIIVGAGAYYYWDYSDYSLMPDDSGVAFDVEMFIRSLLDDGSVPGGVDPDSYVPPVSDGDEDLLNF